MHAIILTYTAESHKINTCASPAHNFMRELDSSCLKITDHHAAIATVVDVPISVLPFAGVGVVDKPQAC